MALLPARTFSTDKMTSQDPTKPSIYILGVFAGSIARDYCEEAPADTAKRTSEL